ncbi:MAG TPA: LysR family transcriptional regulator [Hyphomicrobiales bacterium]|nr:LysR family transcriptional regulator [Hyphomicrobiales bacterium]
MRDGDPLPFQQGFLNQSALDDPRVLSGQFWAELRVFLAVAKAGSFNRAAAVLHMSQPTVSRQVKRLQDLMGAQLLVPSQSGVRLTAKGDELARSLALLDHSLYSISNDLRAETRQEKGLVRVSITDGLSLFFLVPAIGHFSAAHPLIQIAVQNPRNLNNLRENQTDMMVAFAPITAADVTCRPVGTLHLVPVAASAYIERHGLPTLQNLGDHAFVQSPLYSGGEPWVRWEEVVAQGRVALYADNSFVHGMMIKAGYGIGLLGSYTLLEPTIRPLALNVHVPLQLYVSVLTERLESRPVELAYEWLCDVFAQQAASWLANDLTLANGPSIVDEGFEILFNLPRRLP